MNIDGNTLQLLESVRQDAINAKSDKIFLQRAGDYVKKLHSIDGVVSTLEQLLEKDLEEYSTPVEKLESQIIPRIKNKATFIVQAVKVGNLRNDRLDKAIDDYNAILDGRYTSDKTRTEQIFGEIVHMIIGLNELNRLDVVDQWIKSEERELGEGHTETVITKYMLDEDYDELVVFANQFRKQRDLSELSNWILIKGVYDCLHHRISVLTRLYDEEKYNPYLYFSSMCGQIDKVVEAGVALSDTMFKREDLENALKRVHSFIIESNYSETQNENIPHGVINISSKWELEERGQKAYLKYKANNVFMFPGIGSNSYKYFKFICQESPRHVTKKEIYETVIGEKYPKYGKQSSIGQVINSSVNQTRNKIHDALSKNGIPSEEFQLITSKGFRLQVG